MHVASRFIIWWTNFFPGDLRLKFSYKMPCLPFSKFLLKNRIFIFYILATLVPFTSFLYSPCIMNHCKISQIQLVVSSRMHWFNFWDVAKCRFLLELFCSSSRSNTIFWTTLFAIFLSLCVIPMILSRSGEASTGLPNSPSDFATSCGLQELETSSTEL